MKLQEVTSYNLKTQNILNESWQELTESQRLYLGRWEKELWPLVESYKKYVAEATLTKDQIDAIFKGAEDTANASGDNLNALGKAGSAVGKAGKAVGDAAKLPIEMAKAVDAKINELGRAAGNAGPVKNMDAKFEQLKKDISSKNSDSKIVQGIQKVSDWAKANPGKASLAVGILTAVAAFAGGPAGGAAAGLILRASKDLLQGEKLSAAIGKSVKTAAYGAIAGWALQGIGDWLEGLRFDAVPYEKAPGLTTLKVGFTKSFEVPGFSSVKELGSMVIPEDQVGEFTKLLDVMKNATAGGGASSSPEGINAFNELWNFAKTFDKAQFISDMNLSNEIAQNVAAANDAFLQNLTMANSAIAAAAQASMQTSGDKKAEFTVGGNEVKPDPELDDAEIDKVAVRGTESISMEDRFELYLQEGPMDALKKVGGAIKTGAKAVGGAAKAVGKELGSKVTYQKLMSQWKKMGEPMDTDSIMNILQDAGLSKDQIASIGQTAEVDLVAPSASGDANAQASDANAQAGDANAQAGGGDMKASDITPSSIKKGDTQEINGKTYTWAGALWVDKATNKPVGVIPSLQMGLPNPKLSPIIDAAKKDPELAKLIKAQIASKGVKAGTADAQKAAQAGVKGTQALDAQGVTK
jgi:hypothetical protein